MDGQLWGPAHRGRLEDLDLHPSCTAGCPCGVIHSLRAAVPYVHGKVNLPFFTRQCQRPKWNNKGDGALLAINQLADMRERCYAPGGFNCVYILMKGKVLSSRQITPRLSPCRHL